MERLALKLAALPFKREERAMNLQELVNEINKFDKNLWATTKVKVTGCYAAESEDIDITQESETTNCHHCGAEKTTKYFVLGTDICTG